MAQEEKEIKADSQKVETQKPKQNGKKTVTLVLKHKSHTPHYHRCGLSITKTFAEYEVSEDCVEKIKSDKWIVVKDGK